MELALIRGLPGSGKSTYAAKCFPWHRHLEADMWFSRSGEYKFDPTELNRAHTWCRASALGALEAGEDVVVTNTFTQDWEFQHYMDMAFELNVPVRVVELKTQFKNIHGVPEDKMEVMRRRWHAWDDIVKQFHGVDITYEVVPPK